jgi:WD40 repeat protein
VVIYSSVPVWTPRSRCVSLGWIGFKADMQLWDVYHEGHCLRTFLGHSQAVKDVDFNNAGSKFLSASYDRYIKQWDTETGKCIQVFSNGKIPNVVKYHPDGDKQNIFMAGMQDKKIIQVCHIMNSLNQADL